MRQIAAALLVTSAGHERESRASRTPAPRSSGSSARASSWLRVMFLPGIKVPGGENTLMRPVRAFGAPQTT